MTVPLNGGLADNHRYLLDFSEPCVVDYDIVIASGESRVNLTSTSEFARERSRSACKRNLECGRWKTDLRHVWHKDRASSRAWADMAYDSRNETRVQGSRHPDWVETTGLSGRSRMSGSLVTTHVRRQREHGDILRNGTVRGPPTLRSGTALLAVSA